MAPILKIGSSSEPASGKMVGVMLPSAAFTYLTLYALAHGITKTKILKESMIERWLDEMRMELSEDALVDMLTESLQTLYAQVPDALFLEHLEEELQHRGLPKELAVRISSIYQQKAVEMAIKKSDGKD